MRYLLLTASFYCINIAAKTQHTDSLITEIKSINKAVTDKPGGAISNRAMNIFLADKTGYLSESTDLSFYTNYATLNSSLSRITINHNFQKANGTDEPIKKLLSVGVSVTLPGSFATSFLDNRFDHGLGILVSYKWLGKVSTRFKNAEENKSTQKKAMDALRAGMVHALENEINKKVADVNTALAAVDTVDVPGQDIIKARELMQQEFYEHLKAEYEEKFASLQAAALTNTNNFKCISTSWTSINAYLPLLSADYFVAPSLNTSFEHRHSYPLQLMLSHTRLWESAKAGRLFVTLEAGMLLNNSKLSYRLDRINLAEYNNLGGSDQLHTAALKNNKAYIGNYETYLTPSIQGRLIYFPTNSHIGISFLIQQNFGTHQLLNSKISIPVVLINSKKTPAANFDFYVLLVDMTNKISASNTLANKTIVGLSVGIPFSRLMF